MDSEDSIQNDDGPGLIAPIDRNDVHRICSGQVILNLSTAVKELLENSLDAGANNVDIRLKNYGIENLEVADNGQGVESKNFVALTKKHYTSKLQEFTDIFGVETFGFRGEALSSLCALSEIIITTRHETVSVATKLRFDNSGSIIGQELCPRQQGTTVTVRHLFDKLPVRHKEFLKNSKKEFAKMVNIISAYCIISTGIRISCTNQCKNGKKTTVVSTSGNGSVKDNIADVFGSKQLATLLEFTMVEPDEAILTDYGIDAKLLNGNRNFSFSGFVSECTPGLGRSSSDRQFVFVNGRPCDLTKVTKVVNDVFHVYNRYQYPMLILCITTARDTVDVNLTPDKRQLILQNEKLLLASVKSSLLHLYQSRTYHLTANIHPVQTVNSQDFKMTSNKPTGQKGLPSLSGFKRSFSQWQSSSLNVEKQASKQRKINAFFETSVETVTSPEDASSSQSVNDGENMDVNSFFEGDTPNKSLTRYSEDTPLSLSQKSLDSHEPESEDMVEPSEYALSEYCPAEGHKNDHESAGDTLCNMAKINQRYPSSVICQSNHVVGPGGDGIHTSVTESACVDLNDMNDANSDSRQTEVLNRDSECLTATECENLAHCSPSKKFECSSSVAPTSPNGLCKDVKVNDCLNKTSHLENSPRKKLLSRFRSSFDRREMASCSQDCTIVQDNKSPTLQIESESLNTKNLTFDETGIPCPLAANLDTVSDNALKDVDDFTVDMASDPGCQKRVKVVSFSMAELRRKIREKESQRVSSQRSLVRNFRAKIAPSDNSTAESELTRQLSQDCFQKMQVIGQFNLGFIIAKLDQELFIVDQHASDEKYNFEQLQKHTCIKSQKLISPKDLELTVANEYILMDNLEIFHRNGFDIDVDEDRPPGKRARLVASPISGYWTFGKEDIDELIFMLSDATGVMCRPTRVRQMFASRACRKSVMIGTALSHSEMRKLLIHMGDMEQPWNCPHGRPTMRHLISLHLLPE